MCCVCLRLDDPFDQRSQVDILLSLKEEDSYGLPLVLAGDFGGFLSQPPYFSGGLRRGFTFGLPTHRSFRRMDFRMRASKEQGGNGPYIPGLKRLYGPTGKFPKTSRREYALTALLALVE